MTNPNNPIEPANRDLRAKEQAAQAAQGQPLTDEARIRLAREQKVNLGATPPPSVPDPVVAPPKVPDSQALTLSQVRAMSTAQRAALTDAQKRLLTVAEKKILGVS